MGLALGALGVVFGDIGTSPLYALNECLHHLPAVERTAGILGALSLVFWVLTIEVVFKYMSFVTKADNRGEGGIFALLALSHAGGRPAGLRGLTIVVLIGAALLYGDGIITPAISVMGAVEGLVSFDAGLADFVPAISCAVLAVLFLFQARGTRAIGRVFGPTMLVWFVVLAGLGLSHIVRGPEVLRALNPWYGLRLLVEYPGNAIGMLGSLVLVITGAEALYADMGHFGRKAIVSAWYFVAFPGLVLNYFGQGAWVLAHPEAGVNPFFALVPEGLPRLALTGLATAAAIVASQAMISGTFSLTRQAIQLGYFPRLTIQHTNPDQQGQIFLPLVNTVLALGSIATVIGFRSVSALAGAYGVAVTCTMVVTTITFFTVARGRWHWSGWKAGLLCAAFLTFDLSFFASNTSKIVHGGWFPLTVGAGMFAIMCTWKRGRMEIFQRVYANEVTEEELCTIAQSPHILRVPGTAVFMAGSPTGTPLVLLHHVKANKMLHEHIVLLTIVTDDLPSVAHDERLRVHEIGEGIWRVVGRYGYMESPDVQSLMDRVRASGVPVKPGEAVYYFNHEMVMAGGSARMWGWQKSLYAWMSRNARPARDYYRIEPSQIIEIGLPLVL